jgi:CubicO group peptidase (beta-lactamase class C family)
MVRSFLDRRRFIVMSGAGALLTAFRPHNAWPLQGVAPERRTLPGPTWTPSPDLLRSLPRMLELAGVPGLALGIVTQGQVWKGGFGRATLEPWTPVSYETVFEAVSLGKPLFAYAVLRLVDAGKIDLDRPLYDYLPSPEADNPRMRKVTAVHVLSHTSGLPNWRERPGPLLPTTDPGTTFSYSGEAYIYLQRVVEKVTDAPFARFMRDEILNPLGMKQSSYIWLPGFETHKAAGRDEHGNEVDVYRAIGLDAELVAQKWGKPVLEWRYEDAAKAVPLINPNWPVLPLYIIPSAAGSLLTTVSDYARFLVRLVAAPSEPGLGLSPETRKAMVTPRTQLNRVLFWGLGWGIQRDEYGEMLWHWGANNSFRNFVIADLARSRAVVAFTNGEAGPKVYERVIAGVTGHDQAAFLWL